MTTEQAPQQAVHFAFYKMDAEWWRLDEAARAEVGRDLQALLDEWSHRLILITYSLVGIRADCDVMFWKAAESVEDIHEFGVALAGSTFGRYARPSLSYLSLTKRSVYVNEHDHDGDLSDRSRIKPAGTKYLFVYPFVKTRPWYTLPLAERQAMMTKHIAIGHKYPRVRLHTTYSFGLDDQEFVLAFETDYPQDFLDLVMELRETEASMYTLRDTPIFTCIRAVGEDLLRTIGAAEPSRVAFGV